MFSYIAIKPKTLFKLCQYSSPFLMISGLISCIWGGYLGLFDVPADYQQQDAFRIIYVHVPAAFYSMGIFLSMGLLSFIFLIWRIKTCDMIARCLAPIGAVMALIALITGSIWGKPMWGTWWIWDARLTSELILFFLYCAYIGLYNAFSNLHVAQKVCAILAVIGLIDLPIIHFSVNWWFTLHQGATFVTMSGPKIHASMMKPFFVMMFGLMLFIMGVMASQLRLLLLQRSQDSKWVHSLRIKQCKPM